MELLKRGGVLAALSAGLVALLLAPAAPSAEAAWACPPGWRVVKTLPLGATLERVGFVPKASQAWAIGAGPYQEGTGIRDPLIMRFDGFRWSEVPSPGVADLIALYPSVEYLENVRIELEGVFARTASDAWVVGHASGSSPDADQWEGSWSSPITMHWDGTAWRLVPTPSPRRDPETVTRLRDVVAFGPDDVWAVGGWHWESEAQPLAMHWDGSRWTVDTRVELGQDSAGELFAAARTPYAQTLWTVGHRYDPLATGMVPSFPLAERYRSVGASWTQTAIAGEGFLNDVAEVAWNDVWVVGYGPEAAPLVLHRDGLRWSIVPTPPPPAGGFRYLHALSAVSSSNVWAVGGTGSPGSPGQALMEHWDGASWSVVPTPPGIEQGLVDVAMRRSGYGWAVGAGNVDGATGLNTTRGVILRHCPG
jgi:hypothetical protein